MTERQAVSIKEGAGTNQIPTYSNPSEICFIQMPEHRFCNDVVPVSEVFQTKFRGTVVKPCLFSGNTPQEFHILEVYSRDTGVIDCTLSL